MSHDATTRLAPSALRLLEQSLREALSRGKNAIEDEHVALALARLARAQEKKVADAWDVIARHVQGTTGD